MSMRRNPVDASLDPAHACPSCRCVRGPPVASAADAIAPARRSPWSRMNNGLRLGRRAALPAAALAVYAATSWLTRVDLAVLGARSDKLPAIVAEAARLNGPSPARVKVEAPERAVMLACEERTGSPEDQGSAPAFQHAKLAASALCVEQSRDK